MTFKLFIIPAVVLSVLYGFAMASVASAEIVVTGVSWEADCALVDGMVECDIDSPLGINNVHVGVDSGIGLVTVFDESYEGCPTAVHVSLDPIVLEATSEMEVTTCGVVIPCDGCVIEVCIVGVTCEEDLPGVGVGKPDPLPLKSSVAPSVVKPLALSGAKLTSR